MKFSFLTFAPLLLAFVTGSAAAEKPKLNLVHFHADDHRPDGLRALGNPLLQTPNLDTLVARGMTFTHCYTMGSMVGAVCQPSYIASTPTEPRRSTWPTVIRKSSPV